MTDHSDERVLSVCVRCGGVVGWVDCPTGGWWAHEVHPEDDHDAWPSVDGDGCYTLPNGECVSPGECLHASTHFARYVGLDGRAHEDTSDVGGAQCEVDLFARTEGDRG